MSNSVVFIGNIEDQVNGGFIQVTLEEYQPSNPEPGEAVAIAPPTMELHCRVHQTLLPPNHEFTLRVIAMHQSWQDHFAGSENLDRSLYNLVCSVQSP